MTAPASHPFAGNASAEWVIEPVRSPDELGPIVALDREAFTMPWTPEMFARALQRSSHYRLFALRSISDRVLAGFVCYRITGGVLQIATVAVHETVRRRRLGESLVLFALEQGRAAGARAATLEVRRSNVAAQRLYEKLGFAAVRLQAGYYRSPVEDAVIYGRALDSALDIGRV